MLTFPVAGYSLLIIFISLVAFTLVGKFLFHAFNKTPGGNRFSVVFWQSLFGLIFSVSLFAIFKTGAETFLIACPLLILLYLFFYKEKLVSLKSSLRGYHFIGFIVSCGLIYYAYYLQGFITYDAGSIKYPSGANVYYGKLAEFFNLTGKELNTQEYFFSQQLNAQPYHYLDIWLCALISGLFKIQAEYVQIVVVYPLLTLISTIGVVGFVLDHNPRKINIYTYALALIIFYSGWRFLYPSFIYHSGNLHSMGNYPKAWIILCFLIGGFSLANTKNTLLLTLLFCLACICYVNILPAFIGGLLLFLLLKIIRRRISVREFAFNCAVLIITGGYFFFYYFLKDNSGGETGATGLSFLNLKPDIKFIIRAFILQLPCYLFIILYTIYYRIRKDKVFLYAKSDFAPQIALGCLIVLSGLLTAAFTPNVPESFQFYTNIIIPIASLIIAIVLYTALLNKNVIIKISAAAIILFSVFYNRSFWFSTSYMEKTEYQKLRAYLPPAKSTIFVSYLAPETFGNTYEKNTRLFYPLSILNYTYSPYICESLNTVFMLRDARDGLSKSDIQALEMSGFYRFLKNKPNPTLPGKDAALMNSFIDFIKANYLVVSAHATMPDLKRNYLDSLQLKEYHIYRIR